jgi:uncharacterized protein
MSIKQVWLNLPVTDLEKSKEFFRNIGFKPNPMHENATTLASFFIGEQNFVLMLFPAKDFAGFARTSVYNTKNGTEMMINFDAGSRADVDEMAEKVRKAGGKIFSEPELVDGWMYSLGFEDVDGHRWAMLHMEPEKMNKQY